MGKPWTMSRCQTKTEAKAAIQRMVKRVLWEENRVGIHRLISSRLLLNRPGGVEVSTIVGVVGWDQRRWERCATGEVEFLGYIRERGSWRLMSSR